MRYPRFTTLACLGALLLGSCSLDLVGFGDATWATLDINPSDVSADSGLPAEDLMSDNQSERDLVEKDAPLDGLELDIVAADVPGMVCDIDSQCDDDVECTVDRCRDGGCQHLPDDMACGPADGCFSSHCDSKVGCHFVVLADAPCLMSDKCVLVASCSAQGVCVPQQSVICKSSTCMHSSCDSATGNCLYEKQTGADCDDGNPCTAEDTCMDGVCVGLMDEGACPCDNDLECGAYVGGNLCLGHLSCVEGHCSTPTNGVTCPEAPADACFQWTCEPATGQCTKTFLDMGTLCSDGNSCTKDDHCENGTCVGLAVSDGLPCNLDADACTQDVCLAGVCVVGPKKVCQVPDECYTATCEPYSGKCVMQPLDGGLCDDGDSCTTGESCQWGQCGGGTWVCVDCALAESNGSACDDGQVGSVGDFCYGGVCKGFLSGELGALKLSGGGALGTHLDWVYVAGFGTWNGQASSQAGIAEFSWLPGGPAWVGVGADPILDVDGPVAVGKPGLVYYRGMNWTANNLLKQALQMACPGFGVSSKPVSVSHLSSSGLLGLGPGSDIVAVGFETTADSLEKGCVLAVCESKDLLLGWNCGAVPVDWAAGSEGTDGIKVRVGALDLEFGGPCGDAGGACSPQLDLLLTYEVSKPGGSGWGVGEALGASGGGTWYYSGLYVAPQGTGMGGSGPVLGLDLRSDGSFAAVGGQGFLLSRGPGEATASVKTLPWNSTVGAPTLTGVVLQDATSVVFANVISAADPNSNSTVTAGVLAGPGGWVFAPQSSGVTFVPVSHATVCGACGEVDSGALGIRDGAARLDTGRLVLLVNNVIGGLGVGEVLFLTP